MPLRQSPDPAYSPTQGKSAEQLETELQEALDRQAATAEILDVIASSPRNAQPVFDAIVNAALKLFPEATISIALRADQQVKVAAIAGPDPEGVEAWRQRFPAPLHPETIHGHVILKGRAVDLADVAEAQDQFRMGAGNFLASGYRAVTMVPVSHGGTTVGALAVLRLTTGTLSSEQFAVLQTFVAQANIAIDNTHLLNEMRAANDALHNVSTQLAKYMPPQLYHSIIAGDQHAALETRRKKLTIFFSDIVDFAEITDQLEAEELAALLNEYLSEMSRIAQDHGAFFDKFIGDAMMFYFGDTDSKGVAEDASACLRMAIAMQQRLAGLQVSWRRRGLIDRPFEARMGINTGYCTVGNFGSEDRMDYTIIGREVNLAARLEALADPGGILLAAETYSLVKHWLSVEERGAITVKGFPHPVRTYAVSGIHAAPEGDEQVIHAEGDGYLVSLDKTALTPARRAELATLLRHAALKLDEGEE